VPEGGGDLTPGSNSFGATGYGGPAPPPGHGTHHYYFWVYALDEDLALEPGLDRRALLEAIEDHVIEQARLVGTFKR
jgi:Raf kinase inhibitor-like YbhB/YbcL family protein